MCPREIWSSSFSCLRIAQAGLVAAANQPRAAPIGLPACNRSRRVLESQLKAASQRTQQRFDRIGVLEKLSQGCHHPQWLQTLLEAEPYRQSLICLQVGSGCRLRQGRLPCAFLMDRSFTGAGSVAMDGYTREGGLLGRVTTSCRNAYPNSLGGMDICYLTGESATTRAPDSIRYCLQ